jgi:uncharacterized protein (TIGR03435 family)
MKLTVRRDLIFPVVSLAVLVAVARVPARAQLDAKPIGFEVASIKPNPSRTGIRGHAFPADRFEARNVPARDLIMIAFGEPGRLVPESLMSGGPGWIDTDRFDVTAKVGRESQNSVAEKQLMLRRLLAERFKLVVHVQLTNLPIYTLVLASPNGVLGRQIRRSVSDCGYGDAGSVPPPLQPGQELGCILYIVPPGTLIARGQTMSGFAYALTRTVGRVVTDHTGLSGAFDADAVFNPEGLPGWAPPSQDAPNRDAPSFFGALQEQLGLRLESTTGPVDVLMIDSVEHPTPD